MIPLLFIEQLQIVVSSNSNNNNVQILELHDTPFNNGGVGSNNTVQAVIIQSDEKIIIRGNFATYME